MPESYRQPSGYQCGEHPQGEREFFDRHESLLSSFNPCLTDTSPRTAAKAAPIDSVMSELSRLSQSFVDSYQSLEGHVEQLNGRLQSETHQKHDALKEKQLVLKEKQQLLGEKEALASRLQKLLATLPSGVVVLDGKGQVKDCNAVAIDILGRPLLGEQWFDVISRAFAPRADDGHQISLGDGRKIHIETRALDDEPGQLIVLTDLTKTRTLQAELSQQQKLSSLGKMVASLAHQIRTPLSAAILYGSHLNNRRLQSDVKALFSHRLMERLHFMERQINDMLSFIRGERKQKQLISVKDFIQKVEEASLVLEEDVTFVCESEFIDEAKFVADEDALSGAILNLLENAIAATLKQSTPAQIRVEVSCKARLEIRVSDNGCGIEKSRLKEIFEPFYTNKHKGNGLGLAIVNGVVIDHLGRIDVESTPGRGSCFKLDLPLASDHQGEEDVVAGEDSFAPEEADASYMKANHDAKTKQARASQTRLSEEEVNEI